MKTVLYSIKDCSYCAAAKRYLERFEQEFDEVVVDAFEGQEREDYLVHLEKLTGYRGFFPVIECEAGFSIGFKKQELQELLGFHDDRGLERGSTLR